MKISYCFCFLALLLACEYEPLHQLLAPTFELKIDGCFVQFESTEEQEGTYLWEFGDGTSSTERNPQHEYRFPGEYEVTLILSTEAGAGKQTINISITACNVSDTDGNKYQTVIIGDQVWMKENLRTTTCADGTPIPLVADSIEWINSQDAAYVWYDNDRSNQIAKNYGALYNFHAIENCAICPVGWHIPSQEEYTTLIDALGVNGATKIIATEDNDWKTDFGRTSNWVKGNNEQLNRSCIDIQPTERATVLHFDGTNDDVSLGNIPETNFGIGDFTLEFWINTTQNNELVHLLTKRPGCTCETLWDIIMQEGEIRMEISQGRCTPFDSIHAAIVINDGNWHHIAASRSENIMLLHIDGKLIRSRAIKGTSTINLINNGAVRIGASGCTDGGFLPTFEGMIDELRIWSRALSTEEIAANKNCELSGNEVALIAYYNFNQGLAAGNNLNETILLDQSPNAYHATLNNFGLLAITNEVEWSALPSGGRNGLDAIFFNQARDAYFWTSSEDDNVATNANYFIIKGENTDLNVERISKNYGFAVRCLRD